MGNALCGCGDSASIGGNDTNRPKHNGMPGTIMANDRSKLVNLHAATEDSDDDNNGGPVTLSFKNDLNAETCHDMLVYRFKAELAKIDKKKLKESIDLVVLIGTFTIASSRVVTLDFHKKRFQTLKTIDSKWKESRDAYRKVVAKMFEEIQSRAEDMFCIAQNYLQLTQEQFEEACSIEKFEQEEQLIQVQIDQKATEIYSLLFGNKRKSSSGSSPQKKQQPKISAPVKRGKQTDFTVPKKVAQSIQSLIRQIKREQIYQHEQDMQIIIAKQKETQSTLHTGMLKLNIDYFEIWDRIFQKFTCREEQVLQAFTIYGMNLNDNGDSDFEAGNTQESFKDVSSPEKSSSIK